jgi:uncharacterized protein YndB with AHSA1/START domain
MPSAANTVTVNRSPQDVFTFLADGANAPLWRPGVIDIGLISGSGVGARWKQGVRGPGGRRIDADYEVTASDPGQRLEFVAVAGPVRPRGAYVLEPVPEGTRLTFSLSADLGGLKGLLMGRAVQSTMNAEVAALATLKRVLEAAS